MENRYYSLNKYFKENYGQRVQKITIDAGFTCPNIDGTISRDGCIYCNNLAFNPQLRHKSKSIKQQIQEGIEFAKKRYKAKKFFAYYQPFTNTYSDIKALKEKYDVIKNFSDIVGLSVGTRPDCVDEDKLKLLFSYTKRYEVWVEYGLQSAKNDTLDFINRGHDYSVFEEVVKKTKNKDIKVCVHLIIGLPGENLDDYLYTVDKIKKLNIDAVKLHPAHVVVNTKLAELYKSGEYSPINFKDYIKATAKVLESLPSECVIQRIGASCPNDMILAPLWMKQKKDVSYQVNKYLEKNNSFQGILSE